MTGWQRSTTSRPHRNAVRVKARDQVGHGWTLEREFEEGTDPPGAAQEREALDAFFWNGAIEGFTNTEAIDPPVPLYLSTSEVMEWVVIGQDTIGNGYLAVIREDRAVGVPRWYALVQGSLDERGDLVTTTLITPSAYQT